MINQLIRQPFLQPVQPIAGIQQAPPPALLQQGPAQPQQAQGGGQGSEGIMKLIKLMMAGG